MSLNQIASILAFLVGSMSIVAGGKAMQGWNPGYNVLSWLPAYNFVIGLLTLVPAYLLWINNRYAWTASIVTFGMHTIVLLLLLTVFHGQAANQSLGAMSFRVIVWIAILVLLRLR